MQNSHTPEMLAALNEAALAIAEGLSLPRTLQRIVDVARELIGAKYVALGVLNEDGSELRQFITSGLESKIIHGISHEPMGRGLLGAIFKGKPIRIERIQEDPRSAGFCEGHPIMSSFLGVPIMLRGRAWGNLYLSDREDGSHFSAQDEELVELLAAHAAIAIENARLHEELQVVALRGERDRIGMELHDGVIQSIYAVGMKVEIFRGKLDLNPTQQTQVQTILQDLDKIIDDIRGYIRNLITAFDEQTTLRQKVENLVSHFRDFSGVEVVVEITDGLPVLSDYQRHNLLQILRETLANIARHAGATETRITIRTVEKDLQMIIADNGRGFEPDSKGTEVRHFGLNNIEQRTRRLGGELTIHSAPGQGTKVVMQFTPGVHQ